MTEIRFYHMQSKQLEQALPEILSKALAAKHRVVVRAIDEEQVEYLNGLLWTYRQDSFLPHGTGGDGYPEDQPVWLTSRCENPNNADVLILTGGAATEDMTEFNLCCEMLDGRDEKIVQAARNRWKSCKDKGFEVTYWKQNEKGGWEKK